MRMVNVLLVPTVNRFSPRSVSRLMLGRRIDPNGSTLSVWAPTRVPAFENRTVRASTLPLRCSKFAEARICHGNRYDPDARPIHSQVLFAAKISELGSWVLNVPALAGSG